MNGQIRVRVWDSKEKKMTHEGLPHQFDIIEAGDGEIIKYNNGRPPLGFDSGPRFTYMLYTGRKDMLGADIFDGDILELRKDHGLCQKGHILDVTWDDDMTGWLMIGNGKYSKVIGNVHENPELLNETPELLEDDFTELDNNINCIARRHSLKVAGWTQNTDGTMNAPHWAHEGVSLEQAEGIQAITVQGRAVS